MWISFDSARTLVITLFGPRLVVTLSKVSASRPPFFTINLKLSSVGSDASATSTVMSLPSAPAASALAENAGLPVSPAAGSSARAAGADPVAVGADAHDVGRAAAVQEVAVHGVREVRRLDELAEVLRELRPVGDERGFVDRTLLGESDEGGDGGADALDRLRTR